MQLFIDANIFLLFYEYTNENLTELEKLAGHIEQDEITLLLPQQVIDETWRGRASVLNESLKGLKKAKFIDLRYPAYCKGYEEHYADMKKNEKEWEHSRDAMVEKVRQDIDNKELAADVLLKKLFGLGTKIERTPQLIECARLRVELGNPPGKGGSIGDAVNWESLLSVVPGEEDIYLITRDGDYVSPLDKGQVNEFLHDEWTEKKSSKVHCFQSLSECFKKYVPDIKVPAIDPEWLERFVRQAWAEPAEDRRSLIQRALWGRLTWEDMGSLRDLFGELEDPGKIADLPLTEKGEG